MFLSLFLLGVMGVFLFRCYGYHDWRFSEYSQAVGYIDPSVKIPESGEFVSAIVIAKGFTMGAKAPPTTVEEFKKLKATEISERGLSLTYSDIGQNYEMYISSTHHHSNTVNHLQSELINAYEWLNDESQIIVDEINEGTMVLLFVPAERKTHTHVQAYYIEPGIMYCFSNLSEDIDDNDIIKIIMSLTRIKRP